MNIFNKIKKGQSLPLNTIVIAILVIIVLLVIILFFTGKIGDSSKQLDAQNGQITSCDLGNIGISSAGYTDVKPGTADQTCEASYTGYKIVPLIPSTIDSNGGKLLCCGTKK